MELGRKLVMEGVGALLLVLIIALTQDPLAIGLGLAALVYIGGGVSGAHYNPAVTVAALIAKAIDGTRAAYYVVAQLVGAFAGVWLAAVISGSNLSVRPAVGTDDGKVLLVEAVFTFLLAITVLMVVVAKRAQGNQYFGLAIGLALFVGALAGGAISGGAFNPAVGIAPALYDGTNIGSSLYLYTVGPLLGAVLAGGLYRYLEMGEAPAKKKR